MLLDHVLLGDMLKLSETVFAFVEADRLSGLEIIDTRQFGDPFDDLAALRALDWAKEQLANRLSA